MLDNNVHLDSPAGNSGLLDALLEESRALSRGGIFKDARVSSSGLCENHKRVEKDSENRLMGHFSSSHQSSFGKVLYELIKSFSLIHYLFAITINLYFNKCLVDMI